MRYLLSAALLALGCAGTAVADTPKVYAAWSQVIGETKPMANAPAKVELRFVTDPTADCSEFRVAAPGSDAAAAMKGTAPTARPKSFTDITVCRLQISGSQAQLYNADGTAATLTSLINRHDRSLQPSDWTKGASDGKEVVIAGPDWIGRDAAFRLLTIGDTGCRGADRHHQSCHADDWQQDNGWPFPELADVGAELAPDLVIHVGDYRYFREGSIFRDSWQLWQKDFFPAAQPLLLAAPWAFARGNHEGCTNASLGYGIGYFQFFGQDDAIDCNDLGVSAAEMKAAGAEGQTVIYRSPWYFDVMPNGGAAQDAHRFVIIDANDYESSAGVSTQQAEAHFKQALAMSGAGKMSSWWVWHSPAVQRITWKQQPYGDPVLRKALLSAGGYDGQSGGAFCPNGTAPNCNPSMFLLGHQHLYQDVSFEKGDDWIFPQSTIVGHGGVNLRDSNPAFGQGEFCDDTHFPIPVSGAATIPGLVNTVVDHGFVVWTRQANAADHGQSGWSPQYMWTSQMTVDANGVPSGTLGGLPHQEPTVMPFCKPVNFP